GVDGPVKLSALFADGKDSLVVYNMMFPRHKDDDRATPAHGPAAGLPRAMTPCPSCVALIDQFEGMAEHLVPVLNFVVVAKAPIALVSAFAKDRGWRRLRMLPSSGNDFKRDYCAEDADGQQQPMMNVFQRTPDGIRHFWSSELLYAPSDPGQDPRH